MYYEDLGFRHIVYSKEYNNTNVGNLPAIFLGTELPDFTSGVIAQSKFDVLYFQNQAPLNWFLYQQFRIRYESHIKNIQTIDLSNNTILPIPTGNQNWEGKAIILEITHITRSNEIYTFNAELEIRNSDLTLEAQNMNSCVEVEPNVFDCAPLTQFCDGKIQIVASSGFTVINPPLWSLDVKTYNHTSARYSNVNIFLAPPFPYISEDRDPIFTAQPSTLTDERASINASDLNVGIQYRVNAVLRDMSGGITDLEYIEDQGTFNYFTNGLSFIFDNNSIVTDSGSHSGEVELPLKTKCNNSGLLSNPCELWNFTHSQSDSDYFMPICVENYVEKTMEICDFTPPILPELIVTEIEYLIEVPDVQFGIYFHVFNETDVLTGTFAGYSLQMRDSISAFSTIADFTRSVIPADNITPSIYELHTTEITLGQKWFRVIAHTTLGDVTFDIGINTPVSFIGANPNEFSHEF